MVVDERSRHELHLRLEGALGPEPAATLMEHLPPIDWSEFARKSDIETLGLVLRTEMAATKHELIALFRGEISAAMTSQTRAMVISNTALFVAFAGLVLGVKVL